MSLRLQVAAQAERQLLDIAQHINRQGQPAAAARLLEAFGQISADLLDQPEMGRTYSTQDSSLKRIRRYAIKRFGVSIYYRVTDPWLEVIAVVHGSRSQATVEKSLRKDV